MTPADLALAAALPFEAKKDSMRQNQSGEWRITFAVKATDVPRSLTEAMPGTRYQVVIVEIGDNELPVQSVKEVVPDTQYNTIADARPEPRQDPPARAKPKRDWRDVPATEQAGIRCDEPSFEVFLRERDSDTWMASEYDAAECVRMICRVMSRKELNTNHKARVIWHQLDEQYLGWLAMERVS